MGDEFKFKNGAGVKISVSGESGKVVGRADYLSDERRYQVEYKSATGRGCVEWWPESSLEAA